MDGIILIAYILALLIGVILGLIGAGGSMLTVPVLVYMLDIQAVTATGYSLLIVGITSFFGAIRYWQFGLVRIKDAILFAFPAMISVFSTRRYIIPSIPSKIVDTPKDVVIMLFFASLMIISSIFMFKNTKKRSNRKLKYLNTSRLIKLVLSSSGVGMLTGIVGAGGGFLIIPTLIALLGLPMKTAIGTSLTIVTINSLIGFQGDIYAGIPLDWPLLITFIALALIGMWFGTMFAKVIDGEKLKKIFAIFTFLVGVAIFSEELNILFR